jgi:hypothetical protein
MVMQASCLCGVVAYEVSGPFVEAHHCHCGFCRKAHGTPYATYAIAPAAGITWLRGRDRIRRYESSPGFERAFCDRCGAIVPGSEVQGLAFIPLGNADGDPGVRAEMHIFSASKAPWWEIGDALPRHAAFPPGFDAQSQPTPEPRDPPGGVRGSCLCGRIAFVLRGRPRSVQSCHCGRCRKARAAGHATNMLLGIDACEITRGASEIATYKVPEARFFTQAFCPTCGSAVPRLDPSRGIAVVPMGSLDDDPGVRPERHIFVADKAPWIDIHDALPRFDGAPP